MSTISDQKKRTLEALQQQFAAAKAKKLQDEQLKCHKKNNVNTPKLKCDATKKGKAPESAPYKRSDQPAPRKGVATSSSGHQQQASVSSCGESNPVYDELSFALHDNLFQNGISDMDGTEVVHNVVYDIIQKVGEAGRITKGSKKLKLEKGILLDNYVQRGPRLVDAQARSLLIHSKRSKRNMSLKQHKKCGSFDLDRKYHKFDLYKAMHEMWKEYIRELTKITPCRMQSSFISRCKWHHDSGYCRDFWNHIRRQLLPSCTKSWFGFHPTSGLLEGHADWGQALAQGELERGPASAACRVTNQIVRSLFKQFYCPYVLAKRTKRTLHRTRQKGVCLSDY